MAIPVKQAVAHISPTTQLLLIGSAMSNDSRNRPETEDNHYHRSAIKLASLGFGNAGIAQLQWPP
jgi:hypothetical protein